MPVVDKPTLKTYFEVGDKPTEAQFIDLIDSLCHQTECSGGGGGGSTLMSIIITASGVTSMGVRYFGATAPNLVENSAGNYTLNIPTGTEIIDFSWQGDNGDLDGGGSLTLIIDSVDSVDYLFSYEIINQATNQRSNLDALGITSSHENTAAGETTHIFPNMNGFGASGFWILAHVNIAPVTFS